MVGLLEGFGLTALEQYSPLAGPAAMPLVLLGGYFFGNRGKVKGKEASFVKGQKIAAEVISGVKA